MQIPASTQAPRPEPTESRRTVLGRQTGETAGLRCLCYAACSELVASPHDTDARAALGARLGLAEFVPHAKPWSRFSLR